MLDVQADVVVVGAGVAGALCAARLAEAGAKVAILEAGPRIDRSLAVQTFAQAPVKTPESPYPRTRRADFPVSDDVDHWYRQAGPDKFKSTYLKAVGGTTWHWLGTCVRFLPSDFELRSRYGHGVDWPIGYDDLGPHYVQAERELAVAGDATDHPQSPRSTDLPLPPIAVTYLDQVFERSLAGSGYVVSPTPQARNSVPFDGRPACCGSASCIPICPIGAKYDASVHVTKAQRLGAALYESATATRIETDAANQVTGIRFQRPDLSPGVARGRVYVVAAHAVETPRLLLHSRSDRNPNGIANASDQVGRNLMDHPIQLSWALAGEPVWPYRGPLSTSGIENLRDGAIRKTRSSFRTQISNDGWTWPTGGATTVAGDLARQGLRGAALRHAVTEQTARHVQLASLTEQLPSTNNRVALDHAERDAYGVPLPRIHYDIGDYARAGLAAAKDVHDAVFAKLSATDVQHKAEFQGAGHIIGTCRMGEDPAAAVVDGDLRSHVHRNLYVLGSAVFPTSGTANPTLTIAALSLRLAAKVRDELATQ